MAVAVSFTAKVPAECTDAEIGDFIAFVRAGEEVAGDDLDARVRRAFRLGFLRCEKGCLLSIAALKHPADSYRVKVARSAGIDLSASSYLYEFGWVYTLPSARKAGHAQRISTCVLATANDQAVFATSRTDNGSMQPLLEKLGFSAAGAAYPSTRGAYKLQLFVRPSADDGAN